MVVKTTEMKSIQNMVSRKELEEPEGEDNKYLANTNKNV